METGKRGGKRSSSRKKKDTVKSATIKKNYSGKYGKGRAQATVRVKKAKDGYRLYEDVRYTGKTDSKRYAMKWYKKSIKESKKRLSK